MTRTDILNMLIRKHGYESYLELGLGPLSNFKQVKAKYRQGVDKNWYEFYEENDRFWYGPTDEFFENVERLTVNKFDLIFIDADHRHAGSCRDIFRSFSLLKDGGTIVLHDVLPKTPREALPKKERNSNPWCGEVWRSWVEFRRFKGVVSYAVNTDHGCGVLQRGENPCPFIGESPKTAFDYIGAYGPDSYHNIVSPKDFKALMV